MNLAEKTIEQQLVRQLKILNFWITTFGVLLLLALGIIGFFLYQTVMFVKDTRDSVTNLQQSTAQTLDVKSKLCQSSDQVAQILKSSGYC